MTQGFSLFLPANHVLYNEETDVKHELEMKGVLKEEAIHSRCI